MLTITNTTKMRPLSTVADFVNIKEAVVGTKHEVSLVFVGRQKATSLNKKYRNKSYSPNVLSFPIDAKNGEIFINLDQTKKEYGDFDMSHKDYIRYLFIHGLLHITGLDHGDKMDTLERKFIKKFLN